MKSLVLAVILILLVTPVSTACGGNGSNEADNTNTGEIMPCSPPDDGFVAGVEITDAFCTYGDSSRFLFRFTLNNLRGEDADVTHSWTLNEPMADEPFYGGSGNAMLPASGTKRIEIQVDKIDLCDPRFFIVYICVFHNGTQTGYYRKQKSTYDWDYSVTPPTRLVVKPSYKHIWISTLVEETGTGYRVTVSDILFLPPERTAPLVLDSLFIACGASDEVPLSPSLADMSAPDSGAEYDMVFFDDDADGELSTADYLSMGRKAGGIEISFTSRDDPFFYFYEAETIEDEQPDAIQIGSLEYEFGDNNTVELWFGVTSDKPLRDVDPWIIIPGESGYGQIGVKLDHPVTEGNTNIYRQVIDYSLYKEKGEDDSLHLLLFVSDGTNEVLKHICELP